MDPIRDHGNPPSDSHSTGGVDEGRTCKSWGGQGVGATPGRRGGAPGVVSTGEVEQHNAMAYNNTYVEGRWGLF